MIWIQWTAAVLLILSAVANFGVYGKVKNKSSLFLAVSSVVGAVGLVIFLVLK